MNAKHFQEYLRLLSMTAGACAGLLGISQRTVRRWLKDGTPEGIQAELEEKTGIPCNPVIDKFIIGSGLTSGPGAEKLYLTHTEYPRFICSVEREYNSKSAGASYARGNRVFQDMFFLEIVFHTAEAAEQVITALDLACILLDDANIAVY